MSEQPSGTVTRVRTTCMLDCPDACGMVAEIASGRIVALRGDPGSPTGQGYLCARGRRYLSRVYHPDRVLSPLRRTRAGWRRITWDDALDAAASKITDVIERYGSLAILHYQGAGSFGISKHINARLFNLLGGVTTASGNLCIAAIRAANIRCYGASEVHEPADALNSRVIILWGKNPAVTSIHTVPIWREARRRGIPVVLVDPVRTASAALCQRHFQPRPGRDVFLLMAIARILIERDLIGPEFIRSHTQGWPAFVRLCFSQTLLEAASRCGLPVGDIEELALLYGRHRPAAIYMGRGAQRSRWGIETACLLNSLAAMTGNIGIPGGGVSCFTDAFGTFDLTLTAADRAVHRRTIPKPTIGRGILNARHPAIRLAWIAGANVVGQSPDAGKVSAALGQLDFTVVVDQFLNDTAKVADLFLPCTTFLEEDDFRISTYHNWIGPSHQVIPPRGESLSDLEIMGALAARLGIRDDYLGHPRRSVLRALAAPVVERGASYASLRSSAVFRPGASSVPFRDRRFLTASGRFEFPADIPDRGAPADTEPEYPLHLVTPKSPGGHNSQFHESGAALPVTVHLHPDAARAVGVEDGAETWVVGKAGRLRAVVQLDLRLRRDVAVIYQGGWLRHGRNVNVVIDDETTSDGHGPAYHDARARLERA